MRIKNKNVNLNEMQRNKINTILFLSYEKWYLKKAYQFKKKHYYKCSKINIDELSQNGRFYNFT